MDHSLHSAGLIDETPLITTKSLLAMDEEDNAGCAGFFLRLKTQKGWITPAVVDPSQASLSEQPFNRHHQCKM